jgi:hypothetical protein
LRCVSVQSYNIKTHETNKSTVHGTTQSKCSDWGNRQSKSCEMCWRNITRNRHRFCKDASCVTWCGTTLYMEKVDLYKRISSSELKGIMTTANIRLNQSSLLLPVPHPGNLGMPHLLLQLEDTVHQCLGCRWASRHVDINWYDPVASSGN